jgi:hypothetical protein
VSEIEDSLFFLDVDSEAQNYLQTISNEHDSNILTCLYNVNICQTCNENCMMGVVLDCFPPAPVEGGFWSFA